MESLERDDSYDDDDDTTQTLFLPFFRQDFQRLDLSNLAIQVFSVFQGNQQPKEQERECGVRSSQGFVSGFVSGLERE
jgi:hypothetical protein